jgi:hypothetical protein
MEDTYKSHSIVITYWARFERPSMFTPQIGIIISNQSPIVTKHFSSPIDFTPRTKRKLTPWMWPKSGLTTAILPFRSNS